MTVTIDVQGIAERFKRCQSSHICDALEHLGVRTPYLSDRFRPFTSNTRFAGPAMTLRSALSRTANESRRIGEFLQSGMSPGCVAVIDAQGLLQSTMFGGRACFTAHQHGAIAAVVNGGIRDVDEIEAVGIPVHAAGRALSPSEGKYMCVEMNGDLILDGVLVRNGDWLAGDNSGICVIPQEMLMQVLELSEEREEIDRWSSEGMRQGKSLEEMHRHFKDDDLEHLKHID